MKTVKPPKKGLHRINRKGSTHLYVQLLDILRTELAELKGGERFYTDRQICKIFNISQPTARSALSILAKEGLIERVSSRGTFVSGNEGIAARKKTMNVGLISHLTWYYPHVKAVKGVENIASEYGYYTVVADWKNGNEVSDESVEGLPLLVDKLKKRDVDGIIIVSPIKRTEREMPVSLRNLGIPVVLINWDIVEAEVPTVLSDDENAAYRLVNHLIKLGYESIGHIGDDSHRQSFINRFSGYRRALQENGIKYEPYFVRTDLADFGFIQQAFAGESMSRIIESGRYPRAVFASTDTMAFSVIDSIKGHGLRVPEDIAVVGFDNSAHSGMYNPPLTTATQPYHEMGMNAMELLKNMIEGRNPGAVRVMVPCKLIVRESCGGHGKDVEVRNEEK